MKQKLLLALLFVTAIASAQIVNIPDANFKYKLITANTVNHVAQDINGESIVIDTNGDGEIQVSEAQTVYRLYINGGAISNIGGISSFTNLSWLDFHSNGLITNMDLSGNTNLTRIQMGQNFNLASINLTGLTNLTSLLLARSALTDIDLSSFTALTWLDIQRSQLGSIDVSMLTNLQNLHLFDDGLDTIDVSMLPNLTQLGVEYNNLTTLDVSANTGLIYLGCDNNDLTSINMVGCANLQGVNCSKNQLTSLNLSGMDNLGYLNCSDNPIPSLDFSECTALTGLDVSSTLLTSLDLRYQPMQGLYFGSCPQLTSVYIKNGSYDFGGEAEYGFQDMHLTSICVDEAELEQVQNLLNNAGVTNVVISTDCALETPAAIGQFDFKGVTIYPNPTRDLVTLEASSGITEISVYDITGRLVQKVRPTSSSTVINIAAQPAGVYIVKITTDNGSIARRLIRQ